MHLGVGVCGELRCSTRADGKSIAPPLSSDRRLNPAARSSNRQAPEFHMRTIVLAVVALTALTSSLAFATDPAEPGMESLQRGPAFSSWQSEAPKRRSLMLFTKRGVPLPNAAGTRLSLRPMKGGAMVSLSIDPTKWMAK